MLYLHPRRARGCAMKNTAPSFPKWHFAETNFLASAISDHAARPRSRNTGSDRDYAVQTLLRRNEGLSQLLQNTKYDSEVVTSAIRVEAAERAAAPRSLSFYTT